MSDVSTASIRLALPPDSRAIYRAHMRSIRELCANDYTPKQIAAWGDREFRPGLWEKSMREGVVWVVEQAGMIEGVCYLVTDKKDAEVGALYLTPEVKGRGFGKALLTLAKETARERGFKKIVLSSTKTSKAFYESQGFVQNAPDDSTLIGGERIEGHPMEFLLHKSRAVPLWP